MNKTIAIDFDGVIHAYSKGWQDGSIYDQPIPGAREGLALLLQAGYEIVIYSTRCYYREVAGVAQSSQAADMENWLRAHEIPFTRIHTEPGKPLCAALIDDRAIQFRGSWIDAIAGLKALLEVKL